MAETFPFDHPRSTVRVTPLSVALVTVLLTAVAIAAYLQKSHRPISFLITAGPGFVDRSAIDPGVTVLEEGTGYDGEFYYRFAVDPFSVEPIVHGVRVDDMVYRMQRIGYPFLVWALTGGGYAPAVPAGMLVLNLLAIGAVTFFVAGIADAEGLSSWYGLAAGLFPGFLLTTARDCVDVLAAAFVAAAIAALWKERYFTAMFALIAAALTKESSLVFAFSVGLTGLIAAVQRKWRTAGALTTAAIPPLLAHVLFRLLLVYTAGASARSDSTRILVVPFSAIVEAWRIYSAHANGITRMDEVSLCMLAVGAVFALFAVDFSTPRRRLLSIAFLVETLFIVSLYLPVWGEEDWGFLRATGEFWLLAAILTIARPGRKLFRLLVVAWWVLIAWHLRHYRG